jgi:alpha-tubulin suppressor-like RCC1 family protein
VISFSGNAVTPMIAAGQGGSLFLNSDGSVWGTGDSGSGATSPVRVIEFPNVIAVATDAGTNFALLADGTLWGYGTNDFGQLGDGTTQYRSKPQPVPGLSGIQAVAASSYVLALNEDGTVWAWGRNDMGQLGDGTRIDRSVPAQVVGLGNVTKISIDVNGSLALKSDGTVWVWGNKCCGAAGDGTGNGPKPPLALVPTQVHNLDQVIAVAAGGDHHMALRADGAVWAWGHGVLGQNGTGLLNGQLLPVQVPGLDHIVAIEKGGSSSFALKADGTVWAWGNNATGQLGVKGITYSAVPIQVPGVSDIVAFSAESGHVLAMRRDGNVFAWGYNDRGQLGNGGLQDQAPPGVVLGPGGSGQLNLLTPAPANYNRLPSAQIGRSPASGTAPLTVQVTALKASDPDGTVTAYYWKSGDGQQASGASATFVYTRAGDYRLTLLIEDNAGGRMSVWARVQVAAAPVGAVSTNPKIAGNGSVSVALANDGRILTWGIGSLLGVDGGPNPVSHPIANGKTGAVDIAVGSGTVHVLLADGAVVGLGNNSSGEVGSGKNAPYISPQSLPGLPPVQALAANASNYLALTRDGRLFSWGSNMDGALGLGDTENRFAPTEIAGLNNVTAIATGSNLSVVLKDDGSVWAWGRNEGYELGDGTRISRNRPIQVPGLFSVRKIFVTGSTVFALKADGTVWVTGNLPTPIPGDPGPFSGARHVAAYDGIDQIAGDGRRVIARKPDGTVWTGGLNARALGFESGGDIVGLKQLPDIADAIWVAGSSGVSMAVRRDGTVWSWGRNDYGQLGNGTYAGHATPALVVNESANGFLDMVPEVPNTIPRDKIPPFFLATYADGALSSTTLYADIRGIISSGSFTSASEYGRFAAGYNVYVAASIPSLQSPYFQLDSGNNWSALRWPMAEFLRGAALDSQDAVVRAQILQNADLSSPALAGASILVGYGIDPDEMARNGRYRTIFTVSTQ